MVDQKLVGMITLGSQRLTLQLLCYVIAHAHLSLSTLSHPFGVILWSPKLHGLPRLLQLRVNVYLPFVNPYQRQKISLNTHSHKKVG